MSPLDLAVASRRKFLQVPAVGERIIRHWPSLAVAFCLFCAAELAAVEIGMNRNLVVHELGQPISSVARSTTEVMTYPGGVRITLKDGRVSAVTGLKPTASAAVAAPEKEAPAEPVPTKAEAEAMARAEKKEAEADAKARTEMEKTIGDLENMHNQPPVPKVMPKFEPLGFAIGLAVKWLLTLAALKLSCKYWGAEVFWSGLMTVALVDVALKAVLGLIGLLLLKLPTLFNADDALAGIAMVFVLRKVSINRSLAQAVQITMTTKTFSIVVGSFLVTILLQLLHL